jgi:hypothetical protein
MAFNLVCPSLRQRSAVHGVAGSFAPECRGLPTDAGALAGEEPEAHHDAPIIDAQLLDIAASGLVPPDVIARLAGLSEAELMARHGDESAPPGGSVMRSSVWAA